MKIMVTIQTPTCPECGHWGEIQMTREQWEFGKTASWAGELIQNCFPNQTPAEREQLMNGYHSACWDKMFAGASNA
jgi:hypothetical protein